jgi:hypothetical protein
MTNILILTIIVFAGHNLNAQIADSLVVSKEEVKSFFSETRQLINKRPRFRLSDKSKGAPSQTLLEKLSTKQNIFSKDDIAFLITQINQTQNAIWDSSYIDSTYFLQTNEIDSIFKNLKVDSGWKIIRKKYGGYYYTMSFPYFSVDRQTCIIYVSHHCGVACGEGGYRIFRKQKGKWVYYKSFAGWMS